MDALERFLTYVSFDTQSDEDSTTSPSTEKQKRLGEYLKKELESLGFDEVRMDEFGYVYGKHFSKTHPEMTLGLISHMDTSPDASGKNVQPRIVKYSGGHVEIKPGLTLPEEELKDHINHDLVITDGNTLLGADDKAGIAIIMSVVEKMMNEENRPNLFVCFTPDEEVGRGTDHFDVFYFLKNAGDLYAYTVDGGDIREINYENFNAASLDVTFYGKSIHPGDAKDRMVNASLVAMEFLAKLPEMERPEHTEGYEGFYHVTHISGQVSTAEVSLIIRDHDREKFEAKKVFLEETISCMKQKYGEEILKYTLSDSYYNMKEKIMEKPAVVEIVREALQKHGIDPVDQPIRGGTDGARLSFLGIPCPNLGTGGANFHGPMEFLDIQQFHQMIETIITMGNLLIK